MMTFSTLATIRPAVAATSAARASRAAVSAAGSALDMRGLDPEFMARHSPALGAGFPIPPTIIVGWAESSRPTRSGKSRWWASKTRPTLRWVGKPRPSAGGRRARLHGLEDFLSDSVAAGCFFPPGMRISILALLFVLI